MKAMRLREHLIAFLPGSPRVPIAGVLTILALPGAPVPPGLQLGGPTTVVCNGSKCGGTGSTEFSYQINPAPGQSISTFDVGVEDSNSTHYTFSLPPQWSTSIHPIARSHHIDPTNHNLQTSQAGTCQYVLRFSKSGSPQTSSFQLGYSYSLSTAGFHDVHWKTTGSKTSQSSWASLVGTGLGPVHSPVPQNILVIVLDDVGTDKLRMFDYPDHSNPTDVHPFAPTPNLDALASAGVMFRNFYTNALCSPTRACIQTGRYASRQGMGYLSEGWTLDNCHATLAELLKAGLPSAKAYECGAFGKWHLSYVLPDDAYVRHPTANGYDRFQGTLANTGNHFYWCKVDDDVGTYPATVIEYTDTTPSCSVWYSSRPGGGPTQIECPRWSADVVREDAATWINSTTDPFHAYVCFNPPHASYQVPPFETDDERPLLSLDTLDDLDDEDLDPQDVATLAQRELVYRAMLEAVDAEIGYLLQDIGDKLTNTMVFVLSDNGTGEVVVSSEHTASHGKRTMYQLGVRTPMIVYGPLAGPGECNAAIGAVDLWQTIAAISGADEVSAYAGSTCAGTIDSVSFLPLILDPSGAATRPAFCQLFTPSQLIPDFLTFPWDCLDEHQRAVTDGVYKYIRTRGVADSDCSMPNCNNSCDYVHEFYDLTMNPEESNNLYPNSLPPEFTTLKDYMNQVSGSHGSP